VHHCDEGESPRQSARDTGSTVDVDSR